MGSLGVWHVVQEFPFDVDAIMLVSNEAACALVSGCGAYAPGKRKNASTPMAPISRIDQTNNPIRHGRRKSPVGRQLNIALPGRGFSVGRSRVPQSSFSRVRFSQNTFRTLSTLGSEGSPGAGASLLSLGTSFLVAATSTLR